MPAIYSGEEILKERAWWTHTKPTCQAGHSVSRPHHLLFCGLGATRVFFLSFIPGNQGKLEQSGAA